MLELNIKHSILALPLEGLKHRFLYIYRCLFKEGRS